MSLPACASPQYTMLGGVALPRASNTPKSACLFGLICVARAGRPSEGRQPAEGSPQGDAKHRHRCGYCRRPRRSGAHSVPAKIARGGDEAASRLFVREIAQAIAVHLARNYVALTEALRGETSSLPGFKLRRITDWMAEHMAEEFSPARLAEQAGTSEFHFNRLFKRATSVPPSQYQIKLRMDAAWRLLRETKRSVITIAMEVGYSNRWPVVRSSSDTMTYYPYY